MSASVMVGEGRSGRQRAGAEQSCASNSQAQGLNEGATPGLQIDRLGGDRALPLGVVVEVELRVSHLGALSLIAKPTRDRTSLRISLG